MILCFRCGMLCLCYPKFSEHNKAWFFFMNGYLKAAIQIYGIPFFKTLNISKIGWKYKKLQLIEGGESARKIPKRHVCHTKLGERALKSAFS